MRLQLSGSAVQGNGRTAAQGVVSAHLRADPEAVVGAGLTMVWTTFVDNQTGDVLHGGLPFAVLTFQGRPVIVRIFGWMSGYLSVLDYGFRYAVGGTQLGYQGEQWQLYLGGYLHASGVTVGPETKNRSAQAMLGFEYDVSLSDDLQLQLGVEGLGGYHELTGPDAPSDLDRWFITGALTVGVVSDTDVF